MTTKKGHSWYCEECGVPQGRHDQWFEGKFEGLCGECHAVERNADMKKEIEGMLFKIWASIGMNKPNNHDEILEYCYEDVKETADPVNWHSGDVAIAFRRWIEEQSEK